MIDQNYGPMRHNHFLPGLICPLPLWSMPMIKESPSYPTGRRTGCSSTDLLDEPYMIRTMDDVWLQTASGCRCSERYARVGSEIVEFLRAGHQRGCYNEMLSMETNDAERKQLLIFEEYPIRGMASRRSLIRSKKRCSRRILHNMLTF